MILSMIIIMRLILGENGMPEGLHRVIDPSETELEMGFSNLPYRVPNQRFEFSGIRPGARIGWLQSVCNIFHSFSSNSFVDEMAVAAGQDPLEYRLILLWLSIILLDLMWLLFWM